MSNPLFRKLLSRFKSRLLILNINEEAWAISPINEEITEPPLRVLQGVGKALIATPFLTVPLLNPRGPLNDIRANSTQDKNRIIRKPRHKEPSG